MLADKGRKVGIQAEVGCKKYVPRCIRWLRKVKKVQPEAEGVDEEHPSSPIITMVGGPESPPPGAGHALTASVSPRSAFSPHHYTRYLEPDRITSPHSAELR